MDQDIVILSEIRQTEKDRYYMIILICVILKNDANLSTKQKYSYRCKNKLMVTVRQGEGRNELEDWD